MTNGFTFVFKIDDDFKSMINDLSAKHLLITTGIVEGEIDGEPVGILAATAEALDVDHVRTSHTPKSGCPVPPCLGGVESTT